MRGCRPKKPSRSIAPSGSFGPRNRDRRAVLVVRALAKWHDHVESVDGAALKDRDEDLLPRLGGLSGPGDERRREAEADERQAAVLEEDASSHHGDLR